MIPSIVTRQLNKGLREYIHTTFPISNEIFRGSIQRFIDHEHLFKSPYFSVKMPFKQSSDFVSSFEGVALSFTPYAHQERAFERLNGNSPRSTLIATGTGSGKTECFLYPILEYCYHHRGEPGIKAIIIYPMNALATDQAGRIARTVFHNPNLKSNISAGMYVGEGANYAASTGMSDRQIISDRETMRNNPPDILLTNYKMLDYLLNRSDDYPLWLKNGAETLKFIAVDEFHTFDGAQGTDLACLLRRLKKRLGTPEKYLCCIGTSATMGSDQSRGDMIQFASEVFGEPFDDDCVITEDRVSAKAFLDNYEDIYLSIPTVNRLPELEALLREGDEVGFIEKCFECWFSRRSREDVMSDGFRQTLAELLMEHHYFREFIIMADSQTVDYENFFKRLKSMDTLFEDYKMHEAQLLIDTLLCLISHARQTLTTGDGTKLLVPFLNVHVQLWFREMRRVVATVNENPELKLSDDVNDVDRQQMLPVINCRDCGATGWVSLQTDDDSVAIKNLRDFYAAYFNDHSAICTLIPVHDFPAETSEQNRYYLCPECMKLNSRETCDQCGEAKQIKVLYDRPFADSTSTKNKDSCPICGSKGGMTFIGARNSTLISAGISEIFASRFNDDKKLLAFSDSVQDASHKAGFFNARTWRFNFRVALQRYVIARGKGKRLSDFVDDFCRFYEKQMTTEDFITQFIAPNQKWREVFEYLVENDVLPNDPKAVKDLLNAIKKRLKLEAVYEYGFRSRIGRTLEKSACSILALDREKMQLALKEAYERVINEVGLMRAVPFQVFEQFVYGMLLKLKISGGVYHDEMKNFISNNCDYFWLSNKKNKWMPGLISSGKVPDFIEKSCFANNRTGFTNFKHSSPYYKWAYKILKDYVNEIQLNQNVIVNSYFIVLELLEKEGVLKKVKTKSDFEVYGLNPDSVFVSDDVTHIRCSKCGHTLSVPTSDMAVWDKMICQQPGCEGNYEAYTQASNFFGRLYATGDICRIFADEHTGLLSRKKRETVERRFKTKKGKQKSWHINLLSCTPTLELGIDIGDLSSIILCSMPPTQAQFLQRVGRPGRKDGNAFSAVVANLKPHDLYFYEQPFEMIAGDVKAPTIFLNASAVLERQFFAFCFDCWIKESAGRKHMVPKDISKCLTSIEKPERKIFPFNFLEYVEHHLQPLYQAFCELFDDKTLDEDSKEKLHQFAFGDAQTEGSLGYKVVKAFKAIKDERDAVRFQLKSLTKVINAVEREPDDKKKTEKLESLYREKGALSRLVVEISSKNVYNFLSDEGLLPNYAFPEAGVSLKAIIYRKLAQNPSNKKKYEHYVYEYMRPAASAIVEFAPDNAFYSGGRKLVIDQIDVKSSEPELWRLCPNCSHAQRVVENENTRTCPRCGDAGWVDSGQVKRMLRMKQVYATDEYTGSFSGDETDDRSNKFYTKDLYVDVDPNNIESAWKIDDPDNAFGFEYVKKATLRDINFGEKTTLGQPFFVAGEEKIRSGFKICKECGKIQKNSNKSRKNHYFSCSYADSNDKSEYEEEVYLYREFESEALRILIPTTSIQLNEVVENSFIAAVMLGLKEYFGSVDHLRATVNREPVADAEYERIYLTVYDTVPGGTGYLKHLLKNPHHVFDMLQKAVDVMADCECLSNPKHDGCYRCLFAYKLSRYANTISKSVALDLLRGIVADRDKLARIKSINKISLKNKFDSELEKMFIEGLRRYASKYGVTLKPSIHQSREGFFLKVGDNEYFISQQVLLSPSEGVNVRTRADFLIERLDGNQAFKPIAVYTDGFSFHRDSVADDFLKRMAIVRSGAYQVWSLSYEDVEIAFKNKSIETGLSEPLGLQNSLSSLRCSLRRETRELPMFELLLAILRDNSLIPEIRKYGLGYGSIVANTNKMTLETIQTAVEGFDDYFDTVSSPNWCGELDVQGGCLLCYGILDKASFEKNFIKMILILRDVSQDDDYKRCWHYFLRAFNLFQFQDVLFLTESGLKQGIYGPLFSSSHLLAEQTEVVVQGDWQDVLSFVFDEEIKKTAAGLIEQGMRAPDDVGYELTDDTGEIICDVEFIWFEEKRVLLRKDQRDNENYLIDHGYEVIKGGE